MLLYSIASQQTIFLHSFHTSPPHVIESTESLSASTPSLHPNPAYKEKKIMAKPSLASHQLPRSRKNCQKGDSHITMQQSIKS
jgi:elongation factor P--beta-lysine ligase